MCWYVHQVKYTNNNRQLHVGITPLQCYTLFQLKYNFHSMSIILIFNCQSYSKGKYFCDLETFQLQYCLLLFCCQWYDHLFVSYFSRFNGHKLVHLDLKGAPPKMEYLIKVCNVYYCLLVIFNFLLTEASC